ncbi:hypothetical protein FSP39_020167 [Pinctada imbricata]|uniref:THAP-type domain-containing protein n=1 Tax=Pinctada imbricata TaxID=66713 RepID=A0AA88YKA4_PINIB|nr:hypothetical protein FSP39_020167 [Pinctada imbricata]
MPVYHCCVPGCTSSSRKQKNFIKYPHLQDVKFVSLPPKIQASKRNQWIRLIRRERTWVPNKYTRICSLHFERDSQSPTLFPYNNFKESTNKRETGNSLRCTIADNIVQFEDQETQSEDQVERNEDCIPDHKFEEDDVPYVVGEVHLAEQVKDPCTDYGLKGHKHNHAQAHSDHIYLVTGGSIGDVKDAGVQTALTMQEISNLEKQKKALEDKQANKSALLREAFVENVIKNDENVRQYTGFASLSLLLGIFNILVSKSSSLKYWSGPNSAKEKIYQKKQHYGKPGPARKLSLFHEYILTLVRLRLGMFEFCIGDIFGVSKSRVSQIFITWITFMSTILGNLIKWPSRNQVKKYMPHSFRRHYPKTRAIIDCTEFFFEHSRSPNSQAATYSTYKSRNTGKCLIAISPRGTITFVSKLYGGNVSDRYITQDSGFVDFVEEGDDIMADRGFTIRDLLTDKRATLNIPPFTRKCSWGKNKRLNVSEIKQTRKIAKLRIHVERAIQRLKLFKLLGNTIPWSLKPVMNQMVKVSAFICNLMPPLVRR